MGQSIERIKRGEEVFDFLIDIDGREAIKDVELRVR